MGIFSKIKEMMKVEKVDYKAKIANVAVVLDVRTPDEFKGGHAPGSKNVPLNLLPGKVNQFKGKEVIVVCLSGGRAGQARNLLAQKGISAVNAGPWQNVL
jgi:phage shock protein E